MEVGRLGHVIIVHAPELVVVEFNTEREFVIVQSKYYDYRYVSPLKRS